MNSVPTSDLWHICVDTGGTFTDCVARDPAGEHHEAKVLSSGIIPLRIIEHIGTQSVRVECDVQFVGLLAGCPITFAGMEDDDRGSTNWSYEPLGDEVLIEFDGLEAPLADCRILQLHSDVPAAVLAAHIVTRTPLGSTLPPAMLRLATTRATNALLTGSVAPCALFINSGLEDLLEIGTQQRPDLFAMQIVKRRPLHKAVIGVSGRLDAEGNEIAAPDLRSLAHRARAAVHSGCTTAAIALLHSYRDCAHESQVAECVREQGFQQVICSSEMSPLIGLLWRAETAVVEAALNPIMTDYLDSIASHQSGRTSIHVMTSAGGLKEETSFHAFEGLLSGPAGGVVGAASVGQMLGYQHVIGFDMGGTSTDVARWNGEFEYQFDHSVGDVQLMAPALAIETVAAGGGSMCGYLDQRLTVGPDSAGAAPGPACYGRGGPLCMTDVNLLLGRVDPAAFAIPIEPRAAELRLDEMCRIIEADAGEMPERVALLEGWLAIGNQRMAGAIERISIQRGYDVTDAALVAFGGAGGQHACAVASQLGITAIISPPDASVLSAVGLARSRLEHMAVLQVLELLPDCRARLSEMIAKLEKDAVRALRDGTADLEHCSIGRRIAQLRLKGQESTIPVDFESPGDLEPLFMSAYRRLYGYDPPSHELELESLRIIATTESTPVPTIARPMQKAPLQAERAQRCRFSGQWIDAPIVGRSEGEPGQTLEGPALIADSSSMCVIEPGWTALWLQDGYLLIEKNASSSGETNAIAMDERPDVVQVELFTHRLSSVAADMGEVLQRTAMSTNIRQRLDFSCAVLDADGQLVVNAPHIPVHLGSLGLCVRAVRNLVELHSGDVVVTNHPGYGGSHLPDVTVISPVFSADDDTQLLGYVANRAHHAEIGGTRPGSMPPNARTLAEEGALIRPQYLVRDGHDRFDDIAKLLRDSPYPSRAVDENLADLRAQAAANHRGVLALQKYIAEIGVARYERLTCHVAERAERIARGALGSYAEQARTAEQRLDDGSILRVTLRPCIERGAVGRPLLSIDFTGTDAQHAGNLNATPAITLSVVLYVLRLLAGERLPLNEAILRAVDVVVPPGILNPEFMDDPARCPAVVGGNVETSQRLVDTLLLAFHTSACSQGTMNNVLFGNDRFGYYETICGGAGAGPEWAGASAVHTHMTNTRITDPEILEHRHPVRIHRFGLRRDSGGRGAHRGGDGVVREFEFLEKVSLSVLSQHRNEKPYGMLGGTPGAVGRQWLTRADGTEVMLQGVDATECEPGDRFTIETPGGGGWGVPTTG